MGMRVDDQWMLDRLVRLDVLSATYAAHERSGREVTVQVLHEQLADDSTLARDFVATARLAGAIDHEDVLLLLADTTLPSGAPCVVLRHPPGETVGELVARRAASIPPTEALRIVRDALGILIAAHAAGMLHGAVRPDHILLDDRGAVVLEGFGHAPLEWAAVRHVNLELPHDILAFTPPELARNPDARPTGSCDVWGSGAVLYYLLAGTTIHQASTAAALRQALAVQTPRSLRSRKHPAPPPLDRIIQRALSLSPRERFASARSMRAAVAEALVLPELITLRTLGPESRSPTLRPPPSARTQHSPSALPGSPSLGSQPPSPATRNVRLRPPSIPESAASSDAITLPAPPDSAPQSSSETSLVLTLGRAWQAYSDGEVIEPWLERLQELSKSAAADPIELAPWGLRQAEGAAWEASLSLLPLVHRLYAGGLRELTVGTLTQRNAEALIQLPWLAGEAGPACDVRCTLWEAPMGEVRLVLDDALGPFSSRARRAKKRRELTALSRFDTSFQLEDCWHGAAEHRLSDPPGVWRAKHLRALEPVTAAGLGARGLSDELRDILARGLTAEQDAATVRLPRVRELAATACRLPSVPPAALPERHDARVQVVLALSRLIDLAGASVATKTVVANATTLLDTMRHAQSAGERVLEIVLRERSVIVSGEPLRGGRAVHAAADAMAEVLSGLGVNRLRLSTSAPLDALLALHSASTASLAGDPIEGLLTAQIPGIAIETDVAGQPSRPEPGPSQTPLDEYALLLVALRSTYHEASEGTAPELRWVRHIAHRLIDSDRLDQLVVCALAMASTHRDSAAAALNTAILTLAASRPVVDSRRVLAQVTTGALLQAVGQNATRNPNLAETAALCLAGGGEDERMAASVVAAIEARLLGRGTGVGRATYAARMIHAAASLIEAVLKPDDPATVPEALVDALADPQRDCPCLAAVLNVVGLLPVASVVELDTGAWAVVSSVETDPERLDRPRVRLITTSNGRALERPVTVDLLNSRAGAPHRIIRLVPGHYARFNLPRSLID